MTLDKAIKHGKEKRRPYRRSQAFDATCRPHGSCAWCQGNRRHAVRLAEERADELEREWEEVGE